MTRNPRTTKAVCRYCEGEPELGWIETDNNGPIVRCPICNPEHSNFDTKSDET